jgi:Protein of unknown function (DUF1501)
MNSKTRSSAFLTRRAILRLAAAAGGIKLLDNALSLPWGATLRAAHAAPSEGPTLFIWLTMSGGWDQLSALDPRNNESPAFRSKEDSGTADTPKTGSGIRPGYHLIQDNDVKALLKTNPSGVQKAGNLTFGPAAPPALLAHAADLVIVRGMDMNTVAHEVGARYTLTGKYPRGTSASGSSVATVVASQSDPNTLLPHVVLNAETYNEGMPGFATGVRTTPAGFYSFLSPSTYSEGDNQALRDFQASAATCEEERENAFGLMTRLRESNAATLKILESGVKGKFQFTSTTSGKFTPAPEVAGLFTDFGITSAADLTGPKGRMALIGQLFANGISTAVSAVLQDDLDDHADWQVDHVTRLRVGLEALGDLIAFLKKTKDVNGKTLWARTTLMLSSEFSRTPMINAREGRDHHITNSALIAGPGIKGNQVFGATTDSGMQKTSVDLTTGKAVATGGTVIRPTDVVGTLLQSMGVSLEPILNNNPVVLKTLLK